METHTRSYGLLQCLRVSKGRGSEAGGLVCLPSELWFLTIQMILVCYPGYLTLLITYSHKTLDFPVLWLNYKHSVLSICTGTNKHMRRVNRKWPISRRILAFLACTSRVLVGAAPRRKNEQQEPAEPHAFVTAGRQVQAKATGATYELKAWTLE